jgi:hypothetical protein
MWFIFELGTDIVERGFILYCFDIVILGGGITLRKE